MPSDYKKIRSDNERAYGTAIGRIGPMLLTDRYDDRTHFIFELLQNAEDALARRNNWTGKRSISFRLDDDELRVCHFGKPFDEADVRGICGIAESTKGITAIGRFGIGFKSVYAYTDRPEIHSGEESFAIENFVWPVASPRANDNLDETTILIPLRLSSPSAKHEIADALERIGPTSLLFLKELDEIEWSVNDGRSGIYLRSHSKGITSAARRVSLVGQQMARPDVEDEWLIFSRPVSSQDGAAIGHVEIAFSMSRGKRDQRDVIRRITKSPLVAFFPTVLETHLGFLLQGPYRTTPSRDNIPRNDPWNQHCVSETAILLSEALVALRDQGLLDIGVLECLPLDPQRFEESMFSPLFHATKRLLANEPVLPCYGGGFASAPAARISRTQELRELLSTTQLTDLLGGSQQLSWLAAEISADRTPELRQYLLHELDVAEITPETVVSRLSSSFLEKQSDRWILTLYEFLHGQPALKHRLAGIPLVRLVDGSHVPARLDEKPQAFLPGSVVTDFPTVRPDVCSTDASRSFLRSIGLTEPNQIDDVVRNILPKYQAETVEVSDEVYESDIRRILAAFATDSKGQRERLLTALRETPFVMSIDAGDGTEYVSQPADVYLATDRLKELFAGVPGVLTVDDRYACLRGDDIRDLLESCGAARHLRPVSDTSLTYVERAALRARAGHPESSGINDRIFDWSLVGLESLLDTLPNLKPEQRKIRSKLLWEELNQLEERHGKGVYSGEYSWTHYGSYRASFDAEFVRLLNEREWVADSEGTLHSPDLIVFGTLLWKGNPFLESKIRFKPPIIEQLAKEAGIEPDVLDLLKKLGVTSAAELSARLGLDSVDDSVLEDGTDTNDHDDSSTTSTRTDDMEEHRHPNPGAYNTDDDESEGEPHSSGSAAGHGAPDNHSSTGGGASRAFISYVAVEHHTNDAATNDHDHASRMALEESAINYILAREQYWQRTPALNEGFDLVQLSTEGEPTRWCEVKAMNGSLKERPVTLSRAQFECAQVHGTDYWLYIVEHAGTDAARIIRIQDPFGKARTFTFDRGWQDIAELEGTAD